MALGFLVCLPHLSPRLNVTNDSRVVAIIVGFCLVLLFLFVPETFWDRTPRPRQRSKRPHLYRSVSDLVAHGFRGRQPHAQAHGEKTGQVDAPPVAPKRRKEAHVGFADGEANEKPVDDLDITPAGDTGVTSNVDADSSDPGLQRQYLTPPTLQVPPVAARPDEHEIHNALTTRDIEAARRVSPSPVRSDAADASIPMTSTMIYTNKLRERPPVSFVQTLKPWNGRIARDNWFRVAVRPFILFAYPSVLWSTLVYSMSIGWLIVLSESVAHIYQNKETYNFSPLATGLIYLSPFIGGILGTAVAGKVSDIIVRFMTRRNGGIYEPEFRLVMALPIALSTAAGLMGFGWSAQERDAWIVPTIFFGLISFGCSLGSTTSITFCVDSYRQYAGEALVTLNFSKSMSTHDPPYTSYFCCKDGHGC